MVALYKSLDEYLIDQCKDWCLLRARRSLDNIKKDMLLMHVFSILKPMMFLSKGASTSQCTAPDFGFGSKNISFFLPLKTCSL